MKLEIDDGSIQFRSDGKMSTVGLHAQSDVATTEATYWPAGTRDIFGHFDAYVSVKTTIVEECWKAPSDGEPAVVGEVVQYLDMDQVAELVSTLTTMLEAHEAEEK